MAMMTSSRSIAVVAVEVVGTEGRLRHLDHHDDDGPEPRAVRSGQVDGVRRPERQLHPFPDRDLPRLLVNGKQRRISPVQRVGNLQGHRDAQPPPARRRHPPPARSPRRPASCGSRQQSGEPLARARIRRRLHRHRPWWSSCCRRGGGGGRRSAAVSADVSPNTQGRACLIARTSSLVILNSISMANGSPGPGLYSASKWSWMVVRCCAQLHELGVAHQQSSRLHQVRSGRRGSCHPEATAAPRAPSGVRGLVTRSSPTCVLT